jgi:GLPGLI family protein
MRHSYQTCIIMLVVFVLLVNVQSHAQTSGEVVYKCTLKDNINVFRDTLRFRGNEIKYIKNKESYQWKTKEGYTLSYDSTDDTWFFNLKTRESTYKKFNFKSGKYEYQTEVSKPIEWTILNEFKTIGKYKVQKAISKYDSQIGLITKIAWFTTQIPIQAGPELSWGLPGLILEVRPHGIYTCTMESVIMKPVEDLVFNEPTKIATVMPKTVAKKPTQNKKKLNELLNKN